MRLLLFTGLLLLSTQKLVADDSEISDQAETGFEHILQAYVDVYDFSGSVSIQQKNRFKYRQHFGLANRSFNVPNDESTVYSLNSISKLFSTVLILKLEEQGLLDLSKSVAHYLPEFSAPWANQVTLHHLLTHQSGLPRELGINSHQSLTFTEQLDLLKSHSLLFPPGTRYEYSNAGVALLGAIIQQLTGQSYQQLIHSYIIQPLNLKHTGVYEGEVMVQHQAVPYKLTARGVATQQRNKHLGENAGGNIYSNTRDLHIFIQAIFEQRIINANSFQLMTNNQSPAENEPHSYGFSLQKFGDETLYLAAGSGYGSKSVVVYEPKNQLFIAITSNWGNTPLFDILRDLYLTTKGQTVKLPDHGQFATADDFASFLGDYQFDLAEISKHLQVEQASFTLHQHQGRLYLNDDLLVKKGEQLLGFVYTDELTIGFTESSKMFININGHQLLGQKF